MDWLEKKTNIKLANILFRVQNECFPELILWYFTTMRN